MIPSSPTCVITGAHGYLGSELKDYLRRAGWRVVSASRQSRDKTDIAYSLGQELPAEAFRGVHALVHCAYDFGPTSWSEICRVNVSGTQHLLEQAARAEIRNILTISSISAFPGCRSLYGKAKLLIEEATLAAGGVVLRPGLIYGGSNRGMFGRLVAQVTNGRPIPLLTGSPCTQYLVLVKDLARIIEAILSNRIPKPKTEWIVAHSQPWPLRDLLQAIAGPRRLYFVPVPWRLIWLVLRTAEIIGLRLSFKSDSVISIVYQNPEPDLDSVLTCGLQISDFKPDCDPSWSQKS